MPLIKTFSGPRMALLWQEATQMRHVLVLFSVTGILLGCLETTDWLDEDMGSEILGALVFFAFYPATTSVGTLAFRMPVSTRTTTTVAIAVIDLAIMAAIATYLVTFLFLRDAGTDPDVTFLALLIPLGLAARCFAEIQGPTIYRFQLCILCLAPWLPVIAIAASLWDGLLMHSVGLTAFGSGLYSHLVYYPILRWLQNQKRQGAHTEFDPGDDVDEMTGWTKGPEGDAPTPTNDNRKKPFGTRFTAQSWFIANSLLRNAPIQTFLFCVGITVSIVALERRTGAIEMPGFSVPFLILSLLLLFLRFGSFRHHSTLLIPLSTWSSTKFALLQFLGTSIICCLVFLPLQSLPALLACLWILWVGLALAPPLILFLPMVLGLMYVGLALGEFGILFASMSYADAAATWLLFILTYQQFCWRRTHAAEAALVLLTAMTILAGLLGLSRINIDSYGFWILRETLGVALILLWLTNLVRSNIFPVRGAYTSGAILISLSIILGLVFATTGIPNEPSQEVTAACLTLGYVPSLVLPIVVLPSYLRWHHARLLHLRRSGEA